MNYTTGDFETYPDPPSLSTQTPQWIRDLLRPNWFVYSDRSLCYFGPRARADSAQVYWDRDEDLVHWNLWATPYFGQVHVPDHQLLRVLQGRSGYFECLAWAVQRAMDCADYALPLPNPYAPNPNY